MLALSVLVLPADSRDRYREEFRTELCELRAGQQVFQAASLLGGAIALRRALTERDVTVSVHRSKSWRCRLGRHQWVGRREADPELHGRLYLVCAGCGSYFEPPEEPDFDIESFVRKSNYLGGGV